jgi:hypothetical protein
VKEVTWIGLKAKTNSDVELCMGFIYNAPQNSRWYNPNFTFELEDEVNLMRDLYPLTEILIMGDMNSRIGNKQVNLPLTWDPNCEAEKMDYGLYNSRSSKDKCCNLEGKKLINFCERQAFHILNGKYGCDTVGEFTFINQLGRSVIDYAVVSEGLMGNLIDFKIGTELISSHMLLSVALEDIVVMEPRKNVSVSSVS